MKILGGSVDILLFSNLVLTLRGNTTTILEHLFFLTLERHPGDDAALCRRRFSFDELLEMTATGCPKPAMRSVEFARNHGVRIHVRSSFTWEEGTWVVGRVHERMKNMEEPVISGVVQDATESKVTVIAVPDRPAVSAALFENLANAPN